MSVDNALACSGTAKWGLALTMPINWLYNENCLIPEIVVAAIGPSVGTPTHRIEPLTGSFGLGERDRLTLVVCILELPSCCCKATMPVLSAGGICQPQLHKPSRTAMCVRQQ